MTNQEAIDILRKHVEFLSLMLRGNGKTDNIMRTIEALLKAIDALEAADKESHTNQPSLVEVISRRCGAKKVSYFKECPVDTKGTTYEQDSKDIH